MKIQKRKTSYITFFKITKFLLSQSLKEKTSHKLIKRSRRLLGISFKTLPLISSFSKNFPEIQSKTPFFSQYLEYHSLFCLNRKLPDYNFSIGSFLNLELLSLIHKKNLKKTRRTKRRLFHKRIKKFKKILNSYYFWKRKMKKGKRLYKFKIEKRLKNRRKLRKQLCHRNRIRPMESGAPIFNKLVRLTTRNGMKRRACTNLKKALALLRKNLKIQRSVVKSDSQFLYLVVKKINPCFFIRKINLGRRAVFAPAPLFKYKKTTLSLRWILNSLSKRKENSFPKRLAGELEDILKNRGLTLKHKKDQSKLAYDNRFNSKYLFRPKAK